jgi:hypothetical protein
LTSSLHPVEPGDVICADEKFSLTAFEVSHRGPGNLGYLFEEKPHRPFLAERAAELGVPFGPERARLVRGEAVALADGRVVRPTTCWARRSTARSTSTSATWAGRTICWRSSAGPTRW